MSPELNGLLIDVLKGFVWGGAIGLVIGLVIGVGILFDDYKDWRK